MLKDYILAFRQLSDRPFWKSVLWASILSILTFVGIMIIGWSACGWLFDHLLSYFDFLDEGSWMKNTFRFIVGVFIFLIGFLFFGSIHTAYMGIFIDQVIDAIQAKHYPEIPLRPAPKIHTSIIIAIRLIVLSFIINILASPLFLLGWFFPPVGMAMQILVNGYLLGKEYSVTVKTRLPKNTNYQKNSYTLYGAVGATLWMVPIANFFSPLLICASVFHGMVRKNNT